MGVFSLMAFMLFFLQKAGNLLMHCTNSWWVS